MQFEVKDLINKIKKDGLEEAEKLASEIILNAKRDAEAIILKAESDAKELKMQAEKEAGEYKIHSLEASRQAVRDLIIATENNIKSLFKIALKDSVSEVYDDNFLRELIIRVVDIWSKKDKIDIILNESAVSNLLSILRVNIGNRLDDAIELKPFKGISKGFKIQQRDGNLYYDFTSDTIADILFEYLNPRFKEVIKLG
ncbi:V-type ATP synthase subunit E [Borrelia hermsii]|uniref:V-type proton ATPase subunit E n=3 Tax=Borrelia hermsii TaxID=140 RepID=VATE_BORHD|nr:V-type ATP synthase subunit E [Borrelia hermsii]B2S1T0.1 RecName: Full=V-type proton ATPase subunit E; AltName: Full=V-ATPase subunit E [Borrelia hermsii DAH]AAX16617.1 V-type sodium ATP synthase subunit E, putative [Borrelia hermsii DAH]AJW72925.1 ATP synthase subunit E [Borrelia hermsii CC1]AMR75719.1 V-type ATP synthase subunit E [Borrelia hermsii]ANA42917.1 ATP synthase subunit E [Borrelia hermsii HS1]UCP01132.1 V-type ATP synthase subunit E [Borrelia hermsii]